MTAAPLVSLLMPARRAHHTIPEAIESITRNRLDAWEVVVQSDDATDYGYLSMLYGPRVVVLPPLKGLGAGQARNKCLLAARGRLIGQLDADDVLDGGYLDTLVPLALRAGAAYAVTRYFSGSHAVRMVIPPERFGPEFFSGCFGAVRGLVDRRLTGYFSDGLWEDQIFEAQAVVGNGRGAMRAPTIYHARVQPDQLVPAEDVLETGLALNRDFASRVAGPYAQVVHDLDKAWVAALHNFRALAEPGESFHEFQVRRASMSEGPLQAVA